MGEELERLMVGVGGDTSALASSFAGISPMIGKLSGMLTHFGAVLIPAAFVLAGVAIAKFSIDAAKYVGSGFRIIKQRTGEVGPALEQLGKDYRKVLGQVPEDAKSVGEAMSLIRQRTGEIGKPLQDMTRQFLNLARITDSDVKPMVDTVTGALNVWNISTKNQSSALDYLYKVSASTGANINALAETVRSAAPVTQMLGWSFEKTAALTGQLTAEGLSADKVFMGMKMSLGKLAKAGKDPQTEFPKMMDAIKGARTETEAIQIAIGLFGARVAGQLVGPIRQGKLNVDDFMSSLKSGGPTINETANRTMTLGQMVDQLKNILNLAAEPLGRPILQGFKAAVEWAIRNMPTFISIIQSSIQALKDFYKGVIQVRLIIAQAMESGTRGAEQEAWRAQIYEMYQTLDNLSGKTASNMAEMQRLYDTGLGEIARIAGEKVGITGDAFARLSEVMVKNIRPDDLAIASKIQLERMAAKIALESGLPISQVRAMVNAMVASVRGEAGDMGGAARDMIGMLVNTFGDFKPPEISREWLKDQVDVWESTIPALKGKGDELYKALETALSQADPTKPIKDQMDTIVQKANEVINKLMTMKIGEALSGAGGKVAIAFDDAGTSDTVMAKIKKVEDEAIKLAGVKPNIEVTGGDQPALNRLGNFILTATALNGKTLASVNILAKILTTSSPKLWDHADEAGAYLASEIAAGGTAAKASINIMAGFTGGAGAAMAGGGLQGYIDKLKAAWNELNKTALVGWNKDTEIALQRFGDMEGGIARLGGNYVQLITDLSKLKEGTAEWNAKNAEVMASMAGQEPAILAWRDTRAALEEAQTAMKDFGEAIKTHQGILDGLNNTLEAQQLELRGLQDELEGYQKNLTAANELANKFSSARLAPVEAREEGSFGMQQRLNEINLEMLKAERDRDFTKLRQLDIEKERLEKEKEIYDLQTKVDYDPQLHAIEQMKEDRSSEVMSFDQIVAGLKDAWAQEDLWKGKVDEVNKKIEEKNRQIRDTGDQITAEQKLIQGLQAEYDLAREAVVTYSEQVEEMAKNFLARYDQMIAKQKELNEQMAKGATGGSAGNSASAGGLTLHGGGEVAAMLKRREFVMRESAVRKYGVGFMNAVNSGSFPGGSVTIGDVILQSVSPDYDSDRLVELTVNKIARRGAHLGRVMRGARA
jgi:TP901 family phage tail tape measure protein